MKTKDFILIVLGLYESTCKKIDEICENFHLDFGTEEVNEWIELRGQNKDIQLGNLIVSDLYRHVIQDAVNSFGEHIEEDKFNYDANDIASHLYYDGDTINCWEDLERIAERAEEKSEEEEEELIPMF